MVHRTTTDGERRMNTSFYLLLGGKNKEGKQNTTPLQ
jgi:hypothetical protein